MNKPSITRVIYGHKHTALPPLNLIKLQHDSWDWFKKEGLGEALKEISPINDFAGKNWTLEILGHFLGEPHRTVREAIAKGLSYERPLKVSVRLTNKQSGRQVEQDVFLGDVPEMTIRGTFIINGIERCVINQLVRSPGVYFSSEIDPNSNRQLAMAEVRPSRGSWLEFIIARNDVISVRVDRRRKFPATLFLRAFGLSTDEDILNAFSGLEEKSLKIIQKTLEHDQTHTREEALLELYKKLRPGEPAILDNAIEYFEGLFYNNRRYDLSKVGRYKLNKKLGLNLENQPKNWILTQADLVATLSYLCNIQNGTGTYDDIDNLANRRVRRAGELVIQTAVRLGLIRLERNIKERMALISTEEKIQPLNLINARPLISSINEFYRQGQLSQILDQTNPLSELDNLRRISVLGQGGISRERASFSIRDINSSQYSRICPVRSPEGTNIGLVTYLSLYARINDYGFLEAPYRKVINTAKSGKSKMKITDDIIYLQADDEMSYTITHSGVIDDDGFLPAGLVPVRYHGEYAETKSELVQLVDICPQQIVGAAASLIPFLANDEPNRALMGGNMQSQAVPLIKPVSPSVVTGMEGPIAQAMNLVVAARNNGTVTYVDADKVIIKTEKKTKDKVVEEAYVLDDGIETYRLVNFVRTNPSGTCYTQKPLVFVGEKINKGQIIIDGPATDHGELALGNDLVVAVCQFDGLNFEDALVLSERVVRDDLLTSISIEEYEAQVVDTKLGPEELTRDIPNVNEKDMANLAEDGIVAIGAEVRPNDILVGKIAPKGETELSPEERLLRAIFGEKARDVRDTSLRVPHGERGVVIGVTILNRENDELDPGTNQVVKVKVAQLRRLTEGDKLAGRHGNKGVISKIVPLEDMPYLADGRPVDIIISPLSMLARMNLGQLLEAHLGWTAKCLNQQITVPVFEKISETLILEGMKKAGIPLSGKVAVYNGKTGELMNQSVTIGVAHIMKLTHMVEDKTHSRSTGPYSLVTQQPLGGKAQMGGQRLGEMEVWALEAHQAAHVLQEMLTIKSDDVIGRAKAFEAIVKGLDIPEASVPESFNVLVNELKALGLNIIPEGVIEKPEEIQIDSLLSKEVKQMADVLGMDEVGEAVDNKENKNIDVDTGTEDMDEKDAGEVDGIAKDPKTEEPVEISLADS